MVRKVSLLCGVLLLSGALGLRAGQEPGFPYGDLKEVSLQGRVVSLQSELARKYGARTAGGETQWALALPEGQYYTFLDNAKYREFTAARLEGKPVEVRARHFPRSMLLEILEFKSVDGVALQRRFHCGVCDIYTEDFGPCACCGKEMQLIKSPTPIPQ